MMVCCAESSNPEYSKILSIANVSETFTILLFSSFLSFFLLDIFQINLNYSFILSTTIYRQIDLRSRTRRFCLPFFSVSGSIFWGTQKDRACLYFLFLDQSSWAHKEIVIAFLFYFWIDLCLMMLLSDFSLLEHVTGVSDLLQRFGWNDHSCYFLILVSYFCTISTQSRM